MMPTMESHVINPEILMKVVSALIIWIVTYFAENIIWKIKNKMSTSEKLDVYSFWKNNNVN